jgi:hypothetical protein
MALDMDGAVQQAPQPGRQERVSLGEGMMEALGSRRVYNTAGRS